MALPEKDFGDLSGKVVGVRRPVWDLDLSGQGAGDPESTGSGQWKIGVDWQPI